MVAFEIILMIVSLAGAWLFIKKNEPLYIIACLFLAGVCMAALGVFN